MILGGGVMKTRGKVKRWGESWETWLTVKDRGDRLSKSALYFPESKRACAETGEKQREVRRIGRPIRWNGLKFKILFLFTCSAFWSCERAQTHTLSSKMRINAHTLRNMLSVCKTTLNKIGLIKVESHHFKMSIFACNMTQIKHATCKLMQLT